MYVTVEQILSSDGRYKAREKAAPQEVRDAAVRLALRLDQLFQNYEHDRPRITSGYRTPAANKAAGGAAKSAHLEGRACDFSDVDGSFAAWCLSHLYVLEENNLWMEDPAYTKGWVHLQSREVLGKRVFKP